MSGQTGTHAAGRQVGAKHWLIAAWPGLAGVAQVGAAHLINTLRLQPVGEMAPHDHFDIQAVQVKHGLIGTPRLPKNVFFTGELPGSTGKLTVFIGEAQPAAGAYGFAHELLDRAKAMGVDRLVTFASLASQIHPSQDPTVYGAGTRRDLIDEANTLGVKTLEEAQIGGLNGVLLGAAIHRGIPGVCLLSEVPFFAPQVQNPKAAKSVVDMFGRLSGAKIDTSVLGAQAEKVDRALGELLERMQAEQGGEGGEGIEGMGAGGPEFETGEESDREIARSAADEPPESAEKAGAKPGLSLEARARIETMFEAARKDRSKSVALKQALDAQGVFAKYEDRFLDLFRQAG